MRHLIPCLALVLPVILPLPADARIVRAIDDPFPAAPAGRCAKDFISLLNDPTADRTRAFETTWASSTRLDRTSIEDRVPRVRELSEQWGKVTVTQVSIGADKSITVLADAANGPALEMTFAMSATELGKLDSIEIKASMEQEPSHADLPAELLASTVEGVAKALRDGYVFPDIGAKMADSILAKLKAGDYDAITSEQDLAKRLTDDGPAISSDKHLGIQPVTKTPVPSAAAPQHDDPKRGNFGFRKVEVLPGNIGYLRFDMFHEGQEAYDAASAAMNFLAHADAIIFDMRYNGGGSPAMIRHITSYLFDTSTHLNDMVDRDGKVVEEYWTSTKVSGRKPAAGIPLYILTSTRTFSGAEEFTYNLQNLERATIVGETTGGGAHPVRAQRINDHFMVRVPYMRAQNPITHTNWEGKGVIPDIKTTSDAALDKAVELARAATKPAKSD